jgi:hypothetical protein
MNVMGFKLLNGEEILARCDDTTVGNKYTLERPLVIIPQKMGNQVSIGLVPWIISAGEEAIVEIRQDVVACVFTPITEISNEYLRQTTGIQLVTG